MGTGWSVALTTEVIAALVLGKGNGAGNAVVIAVLGMLMICGVPADWSDPSEKCKMWPSSCEVVTECCVLFAITSFVVCDCFTISLSVACWLIARHTL